MAKTITVPNELQNKLIDLQGAAVLYEDLSKTIEANDTSQNTALTTHINNKENPHGVTKAQVGLGLAENTADKDKKVLSATKWETARTVKFTGDLTGSFTIDGSADLPTVSIAVNDNSHNHTIDNITNLQAELDKKFNSNNYEASWTAELDKIKAKADGLATLDAGGKVPSSQLPSFVDDVIEVKADPTKEGIGTIPNETFKPGEKGPYEGLPLSGEAGKIYVNINNNKSYRWGGTKYTIIASDLALGETSSTAFAGDQGKALKDALGTKGTASTETAFGKIKSLEDNLGASTSTASKSTAFGRIKTLEDKVGGAGGTSLTDLVDGLRTDLGQTTDTSATTTTAFGRIKKAEENFDKINLTLDKDKNVLSATKWTNAITITLSGGVSGNVAGVDGSNNITIDTTVHPDQHIHTIAQVTNLQAELNSKLDKTTFDADFTKKLGAKEGIATLDVSSKISASNLHIATEKEITDNIINAWNATNQTV